MATPPTAPSDLRLPEAARDGLRAPREERIDHHEFEIDTRWWNQAIRDRSLPGAPIGGRGTGTPEKVILGRGDVFALARPVVQGNASDRDILRLLWHALVWGSGSSRRQNRRRLDAFCGEQAAGNIALLREAAQLAGSSPRDAYLTLIRPGGGKIEGLGPSFFTKFLYFAGAGAIEHPCAILDARVATALHTTCGWTGLPPGWRNWYATTYASYCDLLARWAAEESGRLQREEGVERTIGLDEIERWLFVVGKKN